jgi:calcineurin-like phosphoesterase family protein
MGRIFITSDTHFGHKNIIDYCKRPFESLEEMDNTLIKRWNERVKPEDTVIFAGDFCFRNGPGGKDGEGTQNKGKYYTDKLNGYIIFLEGNHDKNNSMKSHIKSLELDYGGRQYFVTHRPEEYNEKYKINLVGHSHEKFKFMRIGDVFLVNVGVDQWDFYPITIEEIIKELKRAKKESKIDVMFGSREDYLAHIAIKRAISPP